VFFFFFECKRCLSRTEEVHVQRLDTGVVVQDMATS